MRFASRIAAALLAAGLFLADANALSAQQQSGEQKPADQGTQEHKPPEGPTPEQEAQQRYIEEYAEAAGRLPPSAGIAECVWTGRRITSLLWRDDIDTARRYMDLYERFGCSGEHLKLAFRCLVKQGPLDPKAADRLAARVHACWIGPKEPATASSQSTVGRSAKGGTLAD
jgi:hypothetical protein